MQIDTGSLAGAPSVQPVGPVIDQKSSSLALVVRWSPAETRQRDASRRLRCRISTEPPVPHLLLSELEDMAGTVFFFRSST